MWAHHLLSVALTVHMPDGNSVKNSTFWPVWSSSPRAWRGCSNPSSHFVQHKGWNLPSWGNLPGRPSISRRPLTDFFSFLLAMLHGLWDLKFPNQGLNPGPRAWEHGVLPRQNPHSLFPFKKKMQKGKKKRIKIVILPPWNNHHWHYSLISFCTFEYAPLLWSVCAYFSACLNTFKKLIL